MHVTTQATNLTCPISTVTSNVNVQRNIGYTIGTSLDRQNSTTEINNKQYFAVNQSSTNCDTEEEVRVKVDECMIFFCNLFKFNQIPASVIITSSKSNNSNISGCNSASYSAPSVAACSTITTSFSSHTIQPFKAVMAQSDEVIPSTEEKAKSSSQLPETTAPRLLHPKKRKFDITELEDNHVVNTSVNTSIRNGSISNQSNTNPTSNTGESFGTIIAVTSNVIPRMIITDIKRNPSGQEQERLEPSSDGVLINKKLYRVQNQATLIPISTSGAIFSNPSPHVSYQPVTIKPAHSYVSHLTTVMSNEQHNEYLIDLSDWCDHRVLAKRKDHYATGVIRQTDIKSAIQVEFDPPDGGVQLYQNVLSSGCSYIISDASPSLSDVSTEIF